MVDENFPLLILSHTIFIPPVLTQMIILDSIVAIVDL